MKKIMRLILGFILLLGGAFILIQSGENYYGTAALGCFSLYWAGGRMITNTILKWNKKPEKDELTKKAGYTALALTTQGLIIILSLSVIFNLYYNFLDNLSTNTIISYIVLYLIFMSFFAYQYLLKHPEKTGL